MNGVASYQSGTKQTWRGWQWNRIVDLICDGRKLGPAARRSILSTKTVLYLVGPDDEDRKCAIKRGFDAQNCFAIDIDKDRVLAVREAGFPAVHGQLHQVVMNWPRSHRIDVIVADLCGGLTNDAMLFVNALASSPAVHDGTVLSINLLRGRDKDSTPLRERAREEARNYEGDTREEILRAVKHRGETMFARRVMYLAEKLQASFGEFDRDTFFRLFKKMRGMCDPRYNSYRSPAAPQTFDSVVFRWGMRSDSMDDAYFKTMQGITNKYLSAANRVSDAERIQLARQIAAIRAVRTARVRRAG